MKQLLCDRFLPAAFDPILFQQYRNCHQGNRSVADYGEEFHKLSLIFGVNEQRVMRFIGGLKESIRDEMCLLYVWNLSEAINLDMDIEYEFVKEEEIIALQHVSKSVGRSFGGIDSTTRESVDVNNQQMENYQNDAFKLVREAFDEIHLLEIWKHSSGEQFVTSGVGSDQENDECNIRSESSGGLEEEKTSLKLGDKLERKVSKNRRNLKKIPLLKRFIIKAVVKVRKLSRRELCFLPLEPEFAAGQVNLRCQGLGEEKNALFEKISTRKNVMSELESLKIEKLALEEKHLQMEGDLVDKDALSFQNGELKNELEQISIEIRQCQSTIQQPSSNFELKTKFSGFFVFWKVVLLLQWGSNEAKMEFSIGVYQNLRKQRKLVANWLLDLYSQFHGGINKFS